MPQTARRRRSARAILRNETGHVLLIRFVVTRRDGHFAFWATPGGTVERGESDGKAATREIREELGLTIPLDGPVHTVTDRFEHEGVPVENTDVFFAGRCDSDAPRLDSVTEAEQSAMQAIRWWSVDEIEAATETIFPADLAAVLRRIA